MEGKIKQSSEEEDENFKKWLGIEKIQPATEHQAKAYRLWYALLYANTYGWIDTNEYDDPTDAPDYIAVIERYLS